PVRAAATAAAGPAGRRPAPARGTVPLRRWAEVAVAAGIGFLAFGMVLAGVQKVRWDSRTAACQNNLRVLYQGLDRYADTHAENYPRVVPNTPAGSFV